jgi:hypothetical protein
MNPRELSPWSMFLSADVLVLRTGGSNGAGNERRVHRGALSHRQRIQDLVAERLKGFLNNPQVTVTVAEIRSKRAFITGEVSRPGTYSLNAETTVLQLIAQAGGFTPLHEAAINGDPEMVELFLSASADPLLTTEVGKTAAEYVVKSAKQKVFDAATTKGALVTTAAMCAPSCLLTFGVHRAWHRFHDSPLRILLQRALVPVAVGLILASGIVLTRAAGTDWRYIFVSLATAAVAFGTKWNPLWILGAAAVLGAIGWL